MNIQSSPNNINTSHTQSFGGYAKVFKKHNLIKANLKKFYDSRFYSSDVIGSMPADIIKLIKNTAQNDGEKVKLIKKIQSALSRCADLLQNKNNLYYIERRPENIFDKISNIIPRYVAEKKRKFAEKVLTKTFKKHNLISKKEKITISRFKDNFGRYGEAFYIDFPESTKITPKVMKVYEQSKFSTSLEFHGLFPEIYSALNLEARLKGKPLSKRLCKVHFASPKGEYILSEKVQNYPQQDNKIKLFTPLFKEGITYGDCRSVNIVNGRIVDYGGMKFHSSQFTKGMRKVYKQLMAQYEEALYQNASAEAELFDTIIKYLDPKGSKINIMDRKSAINAVLKYAMNNITGACSPIQFAFRLDKVLSKNNYKYRNGVITKIDFSK